MSDTDMREIGMKKLAIFIVLFGVFLAGTAYAEEETEIKFVELPIDVQEAVLRLVARQSIKKVEIVKDEDVIKYEIKNISNDVAEDVVIAENGAVIEIEKEISFSELPREAQAAIQKDYPIFEIQEIESIQSYYYVVKGIVDGEIITIKVLATGNIEDSGV